MLSVIWDMDGVLLDSEPVYLEAESAIVSRFGKDIRTILPLLLGRTANISSEITVKELGLPISPAEYLQERNAILLQTMQRVKILPGVEAIVKHLKSLGIRVAIATSSPRNLLEAKKSGKDEFFDLFDALVCGDDVENGKPDPEIFLKAAEAINAKPEDCWVFEDAPAGCRAARLAGMKCVALPNSHVDLKLYTDELPAVVVPSANLLDFDVTQLGIPSLPIE